MVSIFTAGTAPASVAPILVKHYPKLQDATELVILGDFEVLAPTKVLCKHGILNGEDLGDCIAEVHNSYKEYETNTVSFSYTWNYVFRKGCWWMLQIVNGKPVYKKLTKKGFK